MPRPEWRPGVPAGRGVLVHGRHRRQEKTDRLWHAIVGHGGRESECGWRKDCRGLSWQITPRALTEVTADPDRVAAKRVFEAMMTMRKIDIVTIEAARRG